MRRIALFLALLAADAVVLVAVTLWYLGAYQSGAGSFSGMMGQMMGGSATGGGMQPMSSGIWLALVALFGVAFAGVAGVGYYATYPEIKTTPVSMAAQTAPEPAASQTASWSVLMKSSKPEEKQVLEALASHGGSYQQKFIVKETGLSKLKVHRIVSRFAERGIVTVQKSGNTNEVSLASWARAPDKAG